MSNHLPPNFMGRQSRTSSVHSAQANPYNQLVRFGPTSEAGSRGSDGPESNFGDPSSQYGSSSHPYAPLPQYMPPPLSPWTHFDTVNSARKSGYTTRSKHKRSVHKVYTSTSYGSDTPGVSSKFMSASLETTQGRDGRPQTTGYICAGTSGIPVHPSDQTDYVAAAFHNMGLQDANPQYQDYSREEADLRRANEMAQSRASSEHHGRSRDSRPQPYRPAPSLSGSSRHARPPTFHAAEQSAHHHPSDSRSNIYPTHDGEDGRSSATGPVYGQAAPTLIYQQLQAPILVPGYSWYGDQENDNISNRTVLPDDSISRVDFSSRRPGNSNDQSRSRSSAGPHGGDDLEKRYRRLKSEVDAMKRDAAADERTGAASRLTGDTRRERRGGC